MMTDEEFNRELDKLDDELRSMAVGIEPVNLYALANDDLQESWLVDDLWPLGRQIHVHAAPKTGKSLVFLWIAACLAVGRDPFSGKPREPICIGYYDYEMSLIDLKRRLFDDMGFDPALLVPNLRYYLHPPFPPLDTADGGMRFVEHVKSHGERAVIIDTFSRVISGDENSNDTYIRFFQHTGSKLKASGVSLGRTDHEGHAGGRSRGASAKGDDVDIVWQLSAVDFGMQFTRKLSRVSDAPEHLAIRMTDDDLLSFGRAATLWPDGTHEKATELDSVGAPLEITRREAMRLLSSAHISAGRSVILQAAINYRKARGIWP